MSRQQRAFWYSFMQSRLSGCTLFCQIIMASGRGFDGSYLYCLIVSPKNKVGGSYETAIYVGQQNIQCDEDDYAMQHQVKWNLLRQKRKEK